MTPERATRFEADIEEAMFAGAHERAVVLADRYRAEAGATALAFRADYLGVVTALAAGRLGLVCERVRPLLERARAQGHPEPAGGGARGAETTQRDNLHCRLLLAAAEAEARLGRADEARRHLHDLGGLSRAVASQPLLHLRELRVRLWLGEVRGLSASLERCAAALQAAGDFPDLALLHAEEGRAWFEADDFPRAEACWRRALAYVSEQPGVPEAPEPCRLGGRGGRNVNPVRADLFMQWGRLEHLRGHFQAALDRFAIALASTAPGSAQELNVRLRGLLVLLDLNRVAEVRVARRGLLAGREEETLPEEVLGVLRLLDGLLARKGTGEE
jgi:tetratricopeptide (TPR) repeat protein